MERIERHWVEILITSCIRLQDWAHAGAELSAPYWRFYWNDRPGAMMSFAGKRFALSPERFFLIPPATAFQTELKGQPYHLNCNFIFPDAGVMLPPGIYPVTAAGAMLPVAHRCALATAERPEGLALSGAPWPSEEARWLEGGLALRALVYYCLAAVPLRPAQEDAGTRG